MLNQLLLILVLVFIIALISKGAFSSSPFPYHGVSFASSKNMWIAAIVVAILVVVLFAAATKARG